MLVLESDFRKIIENSIQVYLESLSSLSSEQILPKKIWKFDHTYDFLYGETVGTLSGLAIGMYLMNYKRRPSTDELYEIKEIVELRGKEIRELLSRLKDVTPES